MNRRLLFDDLTGTWQMFIMDDEAGEFNVVSTKEYQSFIEKRPFTMYEVFLKGKSAEAFIKGVALITEKAGGNPELDYLRKRLDGLDKDIENIENNLSYCATSEKEMLKEEMTALVQKRDVVRFALGKELE